MFKYPIETVKYSMLNEDQVWEALHLVCVTSSVNLSVPIRAEELVATCLKGLLSELCRCGASTEHLGLIVSEHLPHGSLLGLLLGTDSLGQMLILNSTPDRYVCTKEGNERF